MTNRTITTLIAIAAFTLPVSAFAATYQYVNTSGALQTEIAPDAATALRQPTNIASNSGVILVTPSMVTTTTSVTPVIITTPVVATTPSMTPFVGSYFGTITGNIATSTGTMIGTTTTMTLALNSDGTASLATTNYVASSTSTITGKWSTTAVGQILLSLPAVDGSAFSPARFVLFTDNNNTLTTSSYDSTLGILGGVSFVKKS